MKRKCFSWVLSICVLASILNMISVRLALAHHGGVSAAFGPGAPVETSSPQTLPKGKILLYERAEFVPYKKYDWAKSENGGDGNTEQFTFYNTMIGYGISDALSSYVILPYAIKEKDNVGTSTGFGDVEFMFQYGFKYGQRDGITDWYANGPEESAGKDSTADDWKFALMGSISLPTGTTNNNDANGERFDLGLQPGFGVVTYQVGVAASKMIIPKLTLTMDTMYRKFAYSNRGTPGDEWWYLYRQSARRCIATLVGSKPDVGAEWPGHVANRGSGCLSEDRHKHLRGNIRPNE